MEHYKKGKKDECGMVLSELPNLKPTNSNP